jgi:dTDP-4-dehydrorhamnose 3,5-epimerase
MKFIKTPLQDAYLIELTPFKDERGQFARIFCMSEFAQIGHTKPFVQINHSMNIKKGTLRGMHFQHGPHKEIKLVRCIAGTIYDVIIDLRKDSPTFLQYFGVELSRENNLMLYVPEGFAHGFQTLDDDSDLLYHSTAFYTPLAEGAVRYNDDKINIKWKIDVTNISNKDLHVENISKNFQGI